MQLCAPRQSLNQSFDPAVLPSNPAVLQSHYQMTQLPDYQMQVGLWLS